MVKKNANGEGSRPRKRPDGRWEARYWVEGKRRSVYGKTRKEVAEKLAKAIATREEPPAFVPTNMMVGEFFEHYENVAKDTMERRSFETYLDIVRLHLLPTLRNTKLKDLTRGQVQQLYGWKRAKGLSAARVRRIHGELSSALNQAVRWQLIERNVCKNVTPPRVPPPEIQPLSLKETKRFLAAARR